MCFFYLLLRFIYDIYIILLWPAANWCMLRYSKHADTNMRNAFLWSITVNISSECLISTLSFFSFFSLRLSRCSGRNANISPSFRFVYIFTFLNVEVASAICLSNEKSLFAKYMYSNFYIYTILYICICISCERIWEFTFVWKRKTIYISIFPCIYDRWGISK